MNLYKKSKEEGSFSIVSLWPRGLRIKNEPAGHVSGFSAKRVPVLNNEPRRTKAKLANWMDPYKAKSHGTD